MKIRSGIILAAFFAFLLSSCNQGEGLGGSSSIEGYVYDVVHQDNDLSFQTDTFPANGVRVYLSFGDDSRVGKDMRVGLDGYYRFDYLREGNYKVYALSTNREGEKIAEIQNVKVGSKTTWANAIYIHSGKAYGTAMIRGHVVAYYLSKGKIIDVLPATNVRAFIRYAADIPPNDLPLETLDKDNLEEAGLELRPWYFDDVRVSGGVFIFQKLHPGDYVVAVASEDEERVVTLVESETIIHIDEEDEGFDTGIIYDAGIIEIFVRS